MTFLSLHQLTAYGAALTLGLVSSVSLPHFAPVLASDSTAADTRFPDTQNYWGQPFIQALAQRNIVVGYPDNTYRPEESIDRDEFASVIQAAFSQPTERQLKSGSVYSDIPEGYWAAPAIHDAYEMGFMKGYPEGEFRPHQPVTKTEVLVSLAQNLDLPETQARTTSTQAAMIAPTATPQQPVSRQKAKRPFLFPLAMTTLMQPFVRPAQATPANASAMNNQPVASNASPQGAGTIALGNYYKDAAQIPDYARDAVAKATAAGIVVNHPDLQMLNPNQPASRGEVAALIHRALVYQGKANPLPTDVAATNYIVNR